jgi:hypothetical protein
MEGANSALRSAAGRGNIEEVTRLLDEGADVNATDLVIYVQTNERLDNDPFYHI